MPSSEYFIHDKVPDYLRVNIKSRHECLLGNESKFQGSLIRLWTTNWPRCRLGLAAVDAKDFSGVSLALQINRATWFYILWKVLTGTIVPC